MFANLGWDHPSRTSRYNAQGEEVSKLLLTDLAKVNLAELGKNVNEVIGVGKGGTSKSC